VAETNQRDLEIDSMTDPEPASSPCQAPPGYWDEAEEQPPEADQNKDEPKDERSPDVSGDRSDPR